MHFTLRKLFAAVLVTLCLGAQILEATGRWDSTLQDTTDETIIVAVVLCVGAAVAVAKAMRTQISVFSIRSVIMSDRSPRSSAADLRPLATSFASPPLALRI